MTTNEGTEPKPLILVADDEVDLRELIASELEFHGYKVVTAENGQTALTMLDANPIDLVITDMRMPSTSGLDLLEKIKTTPSLQHIKVILMSGFSGLSESEARAKGAKGLILKPFRLDELIRTIRQVLLLAF